MSKEVELDCMGEACPVPLIKTEKALEKLDAGDVLIVQIDHSCAMKNVPEWARKQGHNVEIEEVDQKCSELDISLLLLLAQADGVGFTLETLKRKLKVSKLLISSSLDKLESLSVITYQTHWLGGKTVVLTKGGRDYLIHKGAIK